MSKNRGLYIIVCVIIMCGSLSYILMNQLTSYLVEHSDYFQLNAVDEQFLISNGYEKKRELIDTVYYNEQTETNIKYDGFSVMGYNPKSYIVNEYSVFCMFLVDGNGTSTYRFEVTPFISEEENTNSYILLVEDEKQVDESNLIDQELSSVMKSFIKHVAIVADHDYQFEGFYGEDGMEHEQFEYEQTTEYLNLTEYQNNDFVGSVYRNFNEDRVEYTIVLDGQAYEEVTVYNIAEGYDYLTDNANDIIKAKIQKYDQLLIEKEV